MAKGLQNLNVLDRPIPLELSLELFSFSGGENTIGSDHELKSNEARVIRNWEAQSIGSMVRVKGFNEIADGGVTYTNALDLLIQHFEITNTEIYGVIEGDLVIVSGASINQEDAAAFTSGTLCHAVSAGAKLWITNEDDGLFVKTIGVAIAAVTDTPGANDYARVSFHKQRLIVEGSKTVPRKVQGSRVGTANIDSADGFSKATDAWNILLPDDTKGHIVDWPSGAEISVFTKFGAYALFGFPNVAFRPIGPKSYGCSAPYSIAKGQEGVFYLSEYPNKAIVLWDGVNFVNLTEKHDFIDKINLTKRIFGVYKDQKYNIFYNDTDTADAFPNRWRIFDTKHGRWYEREVNSSLSDSFGYPALLTRSNNEFYAGSAQKDKIYELEADVTDDEGYDTQAVYKTKEFTSRDFNISSGGQFGIDNVKMKLIGAYVTLNGTTGSVVISWTADRGKRTGSRVIDMTAPGDKLNISFTLNTSLLVSTPGDKTVFKTFKNNAVGNSFSFEINNNGQGTRPEVKKVKLVAIALEE